MTAFEQREENRLRAAVARAGYMLRKCRSRNPDYPGFGLFAIIDPNFNGTMTASAPWGIHALTLEDVQVWLDD